MNNVYLESDKLTTMNDDEEQFDEYPDALKGSIYVQNYQTKNKNNGQAQVPIQKMQIYSQQF